MKEIKSVIKVESEDGLTTVLIHVNRLSIKNFCNNSGHNGYPAVSFEQVVNTLTAMGFKWANRQKPEGSGKRTFSCHAKVHDLGVYISKPVLVVNLWPDIAELLSDFDMIEEPCENCKGKGSYRETETGHGAFGERENYSKEVVCLKCKGTGGINTPFVTKTNVHNIIRRLNKIIGDN